MKSFFCAIAGVSLILVCLCLGAPKPAVIPRPGQWTVDIEFTHPQQLVLARTPDGQPVRYWYTIITLTNNTGDDVDFYPKCDLMTDSFKITAAGEFVSPLAFDRIKQRHKARYPFIEHLSKSGNKILQGEDNAKDIAVIWPDFDTRAKSIKIFITGLSNETAVVPHPVLKDDATGQPATLFLRKTLELDYALKSDAAFRSDDSLAYKGKRWIMR